jgi:5-hydroxyisourate hydrolase-like protein (transthyretin family)
VTGTDVGFSLRFQVTAANSANSVVRVTEQIGPIVGATESLPPTVSVTAPPEQQAVATPPAPDTGPANGRNQAGQPSLSLQFTTNQRAVDTIPFGQIAYAGGLLINERGEPITDASIALEERSAAGGDFHHLADVVTDHDGVYRAQIGPGPSRLVRATYRAHRLDRDPAATAQVQLAVLATGLLQAQHSRLTLGDQALFRGRLAGDPFPASGIPITLEAKDGPRWAQVARSRTARDGQFTFRYRFCKTVRTYTYGFRVSVGQTAGWPYDPGTTNQVRVQVKVPKRVTRRIVRRCR